MDDVLVKAREYQDDVAVRAKAHEVSAESHRRRGERLGNATTIVSGIVGSAIFLTISIKRDALNILSFSFGFEKLIEIFESYVKGDGAK